jgi:hypothetical protein
MKAAAKRRPAQTLETTTYVFLILAGMAAGSQSGNNAVK